jgi:hypothetical protein
MLMVEFRPAALLAPGAPTDLQQATEFLPAGEFEASKVFGGELRHGRDKD